MSIKFHESLKGIQFEDNIDLINREIAKRKSKWHLDSINYIDYDDISQILRIHIFKKWKQYDITKPLVPWINTVLTNQLSNLIRNHYTNFARPCLRCDAALGENECKIYGVQCEKCPLYLEWKKKKESAYYIKIPVSIENHTIEINKLQENHKDLTNYIKKAHVVMRKYLKPNEWRVYYKLYILQKDEGTVIKELGYEGKPNRCRQLFNIKIDIIKKFKELVDKGLIDI